MKKLCLALILFVGSCQRAHDEAATLVLRNGRVYAVNPEQPWAHAVAIRGERILSEEIYRGDSG